MKKDKDPFTFYNAPTKIFVEKNDNAPSDEGNFLPQKKNGEHLGATIHARKITIWQIILFFGIAVILSRLTYLQIIKGDSFRALSEENRIRILEIKANRGIIMDRNKKILVKNEPNLLLELIPVDMPKDQAGKDRLMGVASSISGKSLSEIVSLIKDANEFSYEPIIVSENITHEQAIRIRIESYGVQGISLGIDTRREYNINNTMSLSHILGYLGRIGKSELENKATNGYNSTDSMGKVGLEAQYENILKGKKGKEQIEVDSFGRRKQKLAYVEQQSGDNLILTIDYNIQKKLEDALALGLKKNNKKKGAAIAIDPRTGEILAMVSLPSFNNNIFSKGISEVEFEALLKDPNNPLFNRSIKGLYPSGSTIKPIIALAALEEGIVNRWTSVSSVGGIKVSKWFFTDWKAGGHGPTNITKAIAESVNTYFYFIGGGYENFKGLGVEKIAKYASLAGAGKATGIDLPGEEEGLLPNEEWKEKTKNEAWYIGDTYHMAIGQGDMLVTPLQVAQWTAMISNGGSLYTPHLIRSVTRKEGVVVQKINPTKIHGNIFLSDNIKIIQEGMRETIRAGSAGRLIDFPIKVAEKTEPAQWSTKTEDHAWFTRFAPYENPTIALTILIEEGGEGSSVAVPVSKDFYQWWSSYDGSEENVDKPDIDK